MNFKVNLKSKAFTRIFHELRDAKTRFVINYGGSGSSKSYSQCQYEILNILQSTHDTLVFRKYSTDLKDSIFKVCREIIYKWNLEDYFTIHDSQRKELLVKQSGHAIVFKGLDDPEKIKSIHGFNRIIYEEASQGSFDEFLELNRRIRGMDNIQITALFNPVSDTHWLKQHFFDTDSIRKQTTFIHSTVKDNPFNDADYINQLENLKDINYNHYKIYYLGQWGRMEVKKPFAYGFDFKKHVKQDNSLQINYALPVIVSFDFNIDPTTAIICQYDLNFIHIIDEFRLMDGNVYQICEQIKTYFANKNVYLLITGDATGRNRSAMTKGALNYYKVIASELKLNETAFKIPSVNPSVENTRMLLNAMLIKHENFYINSKCKYLIDDLMYCEVNDLGDIDKTKDKHRTHLLDCLRYYLFNFHFDFIKKNNIFVKK